MKRLLLVLCLCAISSIVLARQDTILVFEGRLDTSPIVPQTIKTCLSKEERLSRDFGGIIQVVCENGMSEEMQYCIKVAAQLWEEKLSIPKSIVLRFEKERLGVGAADFAAMVVYSSSLTSGSNITYPKSYYMNFLDDRGTETREDAIIRINEDVDWDYGFGESSSNKKNLTTAMLRGIAMSLGFGSSVINNSAKGILFAQKKFFSPFDNLIVNSNGIHLNAMPNNGRTSPELVSYVTGNNAYYKVANDSKLKLYAPDIYEDYNTLNYFDTNGDLMSYNMRIGDRNLQIDENTLGVIQDMGWRTVDNDLKIVADGMDDTGMASAFQAYTFRAEANVGSIINYTWKYELLSKEEKFVIIKTGNEASFTIDKVDDITKYHKNVNGDIKGKITLSAVVNGKSRMKEFYVNLAAKPSFVSVKVDAITPVPGIRLYDLDITVIYNGADYLYVKREEEWSFAVETRYVYEPYIAHLHFASIDMDGMAWIDLELKNKEGKATHTIEIPVQSNLVSISNLGNRVLDSDVKQVEATDLQGKVVLRTDTYDDINQLPAGIYIVNTIYTDGRCVTKKIHQK